MADFAIKQGDTSPMLKAQLQDNDGNPIDLTSSDIEFHMKNQKTGDLVVNSAAVIDDATTGQVHYAWKEGDTDIVGRYDAEFQVTYPGGTIETFPNNTYMEIMIYKELA